MEIVLIVALIELELIEVWIEFKSRLEINSMARFRREILAEFGSRLKFELRFLVDENIDVEKMNLTLPRLSNSVRNNQKILMRNIYVMRVYTHFVYRVLRHLFNSWRIARLAR